jgi:hypothetical protein
MKRKGFSRRYFIRIVSATPFAIMLGGIHQARASASPEEALRTLILAIGPWEEDRRIQAEDFVKRFLAARGISEPFLTQAETVIRLASHTPFQDQPLALHSLDLADYSDAEKELLTSLTTQVYSLFEVHYFHVAGMPDVGVCKGRGWYTLPPSEW